jgi:hypothetical protein
MAQSLGFLAQKQTSEFGFAFTRNAIDSGLSMAQSLGFLAQKQTSEFGFAFTRNRTQHQIRQRRRVENQRLTNQTAARPRLFQDEKRT